MRFSLLLAALLAAAGLAAAVPSLQQQLAQAAGVTAVVGGDGALVVEGLRFEGCPRHSLRVQLLADGDAASEAALAAAPALDFESTFDAQLRAWRLRVVAADGSLAAGRVDVWCAACRDADGAPLVGLLSSLALPAGGDAAVVVVLDGATVPSPAGAAAELSASRRRLAEAAAAAGCSLTVGGKAYAFSTCTEVAGGKMKVFFNPETVDADTTRLRVGFSAATDGKSWAGVGLTGEYGGMFGASAGITWPAGAGGKAAVGGFLLDAYTPALVWASKGSLELSDTAAESGANSLKGVFTMTVPSLTAGAGVDLEWLYALGPMTGKANAPLGTHVLYSNAPPLKLKAATPTPAPAAKQPMTPVPTTNTTGKGDGQAPVPPAPKQDVKPEEAQATPVAPGAKNVTAPQPKAPEPKAPQPKAPEPKAPQPKAPQPKAPQPKQEPAKADPKPTGAAAAGGLTMEAVAAKGTAAACWTVMDGKVYDLTKWLPKHPGGAPILISSCCGQDCTAAFNNIHRGGSPLQYREQYVLGPLEKAAATPAPTAKPTPTATVDTTKATGKETSPVGQANPTAAAQADTKAPAAAALTMAAVAAKGTAAACWTVMDGKVYDLTQWLPKHPGGAPILISNCCGKDCTSAFNNIHPGGSPLQYREQYVLGPLAADTVATPKPTAPVATPKPAAAIPPATAAAIAGTTTVGAPASDCSLKLGGTTVTFTSCAKIDMPGAPMQLLWKAELQPGNPAKSTLTVGMLGASPNGYLAVGFPAQPTQMTGAQSAILQACTPADTGCTNGALLSEWFLGSTSSADVQPANALSFSAVQAEAQPGGVLAGVFSMPVDTPKRRRSLLAAVLQGPGGDMPLIFAAGPASGGRPLRHFATSSATLPLLSADAAGASTTTVSGSVDSTDSSLIAAHGWMAAIGWGVMVPLGIVLARSFKEWDPKWFHAHRILMGLGFTIGTIAMGLGFALVDGKWDTPNSTFAVHRNMGVACTVLGFTQLSALLFRPQKGAKYRFAWELWHHWVGRSAAILAIANIYWGCLYMGEFGVWTWGIYTAWLVAIVSVSVVKDVTTYMSKGKGGEKQYASFEEGSGGSPVNGANAQFMQSASGKGSDLPSKGGSATSFVDAAV